MLADAQALAQHGLLNGSQLAQLKGGNGYKNLAQDLQLLSHVMRQDWDKIQNKSGTTADDLKAAYQMSVRLMRIVGLREQGPALLAAATDRRLRAFTHFINVYEDVRRAVAYLRGRQGDADSIAPSLYPGRPRRKPADPDPTAPPPNVTDGSRAPCSASGHAVHSCARGFARAGQRCRHCEQGPVFGLSERCITTHEHEGVPNHETGIESGSVGTPRELGSRPWRSQRFRLSRALAGR